MFTPAPLLPVSPVVAPARRGRVPLLLAGLSCLTLGLAGCGAGSPGASSQGAEVAYPSAEGGADSAASDVDEAESESPSDGQVQGGPGGRATVAPAPVSEASEGEAEAPFETLQQVAADYDRMLSQGGGVDCSTAQDLVQRICYLAERVCGLAGVAGADAAEQDADAQCAEGRARCARSETRLRSACPSSR